MSEEEKNLESIFDQITSNEKIVKKTSESREEKRLAKEKKEQQKIRKMFLEREHASLVEKDDEHERMLRKIALKGVVQLFNAISEHQHKLKLAKVTDDDVTKDIDDYIDETVTKDEF